MNQNPKFKIAPIKGIDEQKGTIDFTLTSKTIDRDGEVVIPMGVNLDNFRKNPVFLWAHSRRDPSIGRVIPETIRQTENDITATVEFDLDDPFAKLIFGKFKKKHLNAGSISFIPKEFDKPVLEGQTGSTFTESELLEFSAVPVPSNPQALTAMKEFAGQDSGWIEVIKAFYEQEPEGGPEEWCKYLESQKYEKNQPEPEENTKKQESEQQSEEKTMSILPSLVDDIPESFEWIMVNLTHSALSWLRQSPEITGEEIPEFAPLIATFDDRAIVCKMIFDDRPWSEFPCFEGRWSTVEGKPAWQGEPRPVKIAVEIIRKAYEKLTTNMDVDNSPWKGAVSYSGTPTADRGTSWSGSAARNRVAKWASRDGSGDKDKISWPKYRRAFAWYDSGNIENFGSYKLPHHDVMDGELKTVWRGVTAAMAALLGARGGTNIPDGDRRAVYNHLSKHYRQFDEDPPAFKNYVEAAEAMINLLNDEEKTFEEKQTEYSELTVYYQQLGLKAPELSFNESKLTTDEILKLYEHEIIKQTVLLLQGGSSDGKGNPRK